MTDDATVHRLVATFDDLGPEIAAAGDVLGALPIITKRGVELVPGADYAGISRPYDGSFETVAATNQLVIDVDAVQYGLGQGPCVDAALTASINRCNDLSADPRWPDFGHRAVELGIESMLSFRMYFEDDDYIAALNFYASHVDAFDDADEVSGLALATIGAIAVTSARRSQRIGNLERALASNRDIGVAIGVLMGMHRLTREQAFDLLRMASQSRHRKLADIAHDVAETGSLDVL